MLATFIEQQWIYSELIWTEQLVNTSVQDGSRTPSERRRLGIGSFISGVLFSSLLLSGPAASSSPCSCSSPPSPSSTGGLCRGWKITSKNSSWRSPRSILQLRTICSSLRVQAHRHRRFRSFRRLAQSRPGPTSLPPRLSSSSPSHPAPSPREAICNW